MLHNLIQRVTQRRTRKTVDSVRTCEELEKALKKLVHVDADILFWTKEWVKARNLQDKVLLCGAPFEADAQLVQLERQGIVDGIITDDCAFVLTD